jgi:hypothetical protein
MIEIVNLCQPETPENQSAFAHDIKSMNENPGQVVTIQDSTMWEIIGALPPVYFEGMTGMGEPHNTVQDIDGKYRESFYWTYQPKLDAFEKCQAGLIKIGDDKPRDPVPCFGCLAPKLMARKAFTFSPLTNWRKWPGYDENRPIKEGITRRINEANEKGEVLSVDYLTTAILEFGLQLDQALEVPMFEKALSNWLLDGVTDADKNMKEEGF